MPHVENAARAELWERWKQAHVEYRAEVALGWDRQKLFALNLALTVGLAAVGVRTREMRLACCAAAMAALASVFIIVTAHARYRAARDSLQRLEDQLGFADLQTTDGQREARGQARRFRLRVVDVLACVLVLLTLLDVALALG